MYLFIVLLLVGGRGGRAHAQVTGRCSFAGKPPEMAEINMDADKLCSAQHADALKEETAVVDDKGGLANVIVSVKKEGSKLKADVPKEPAEITQRGCQYIPHVLPVMIGQAMLAKNDDPFMHNVHGLANDNPAFYIVEPNKDPGKPLPPFTAVETFRIKCDVHPWMTAFIRVLDNPYFATSKTDGTFAIAGLPDGEYTFVAWHEKFGEMEAKGTVKAGKAEVNFTFKDADAMGPANDAVKPVVIDNKAAACPNCGKATLINSENLASSIGPQAKTK